MKFHSVSLILTLILSLSLSAEAQSFAERFNRIDRDGDSKVTSQELPRAELVQRLDRNGDGVIERSEIPGAGTTTRTQPRSAGVGDLYLYTLKDGSTKQVSTDDSADYRYPHGEATPK